MTAVDSLVEHLFRRESGKMVSALTRLFGPDNLDLAEDIVQEVLLQALQRWPFDGVPQNPRAWLYQAARNKAIDVLRHRQLVRRLEPDVGDCLSAPPHSFVERLFLEGEIEDDTLRMMFICCHPVLPLESQIAMILKILGGFSVAEVGRALLTPETAIQKRLSRAKQRLREERVPFEVPAAHEIGSRREAVLAALYLMFNESYNASFTEHPIRKDVALETMRLCKILTGHPVGAHPSASALMALMCFHAARFDARLDDRGHLVTLKRQDRSRWNRVLIAEGFRYLERSAQGEEISQYHLEAGIAALHCRAGTWEATDWASILRHYDLLITLNPSPVVALNRAIALAQVHGPARGLASLRAIPDAEVLETYHLFPAAVGELHFQLGEMEEAGRHFERALASRRRARSDNFSRAS